MRNFVLICFLFTLCFTHSFGVLTWNDFMKKAKQSTYQLSEKLEPFVLEHYPFNNVSEQCTRSLFRYAGDLKNWETWSVTMFDATGKPPNSFLRGTNTDFGSFDDCLEIEVSKNEASDSFKGQFCMLHMQSPIIGPINRRIDNGKAYFEKYGHPPNWMSDTMEFDGLLKNFGLYLGICIPSTCSEEDIINIVKAYTTKSADLKVSLTDCQIEEPKSWPLSAKLSLLVILCLVAFCSIGTYLDSYEQKEEEKSLVGKMLMAFSVSKNWDEFSRLKEKEHPLDFITGIKFWLSMWVAFGHGFIYDSFWKEKFYTNFLNVMKMMTPITIFIENTTCVVEHHFCVSGFLLTYTFWKKLEKSNGNISLKEVFTQKIFRLAPAQIFLILLLFVIPMTYNGPIWNSTWNDELRKCYNFGWSNLLFFQNFHHYTNICWLHTWYIATSIQIQIISVLLLVLIYRHPKTGILCGFLINLGCYWHAMYISTSKGYLLPSLKSLRDFEVIRDYLTDMYFKPYSHVASHTIGMILGWLVIKGYRLPKKYHIPLWFLYFPSSVSLLFSVYSRTEDATLIALHHAFRNTIQSLIFSWLLYTCAIGSAGYIRKFFSSSVFTTLERLSYCIYLLHPVVIVFFHSVLRERVYMSKIQHTIEGFSVVLGTLVLATVGHLLVEKPFNNLYDIWQNRKTAPNEKETGSLIKNGFKNGHVKKEI